MKRKVAKYQIVTLEYTLQVDFIATASDIFCSLENILLRADTISAIMTFSNLSYVAFIFCKLRCLQR